MNKKPLLIGLVVLALAAVAMVGTTMLRQQEEAAVDEPITASDDVVRAWEKSKAEAEARSGGPALEAPEQGYAGTGSGARRAPSVPDRPLVSRTVANPGGAVAPGVGTEVVAESSIAIPAGPQGPPPPMADSARGRVAVTGAVPFTRVELRPRAGFPLRLVGELAEEIRPLAGVELWAGGRRTVDGALEVLRYLVLSVDGVPAIDGILVADTSGVYVETIAGTRHLIPNPPDSLRALPGSRVWVTGDPAAGIAAYGVIRRAK
jgi:hypothetical protein